ncbi:hypothetical protein F5X98DRAFT_381587 [Xylaria grammica]|nr:hypothetical protein F5X98DRAFT_381587 [Xylaria grammica]
MVFDASTLVILTVPGAMRTTGPVRRDYAHSGTSSREEVEVVYDLGPKARTTRPVLFLADSASGLSNIRVAASYGLLEHAPYVELHYAFLGGRGKGRDARLVDGCLRFPCRKADFVARAARADYIAAVYRHIGSISSMTFPPGCKGAERQAAGMSFRLDPWDTDEYLRLYRHVRCLVVLLNMSLCPALDATCDLNRAFVMVSPNAVADTIAAGQPRGKSLWKYPACVVTLTKSNPNKREWHVLP